MFNSLATEHSGHAPIVSVFTAIPKQPTGIDINFLTRFRLMLSPCAILDTRAAVQSVVLARGQDLRRRVPATLYVQRRGRRPRRHDAATSRV